MGIDILKLAGSDYLRQNAGRAQFDVETFGSLDLLPRAQNVGILLQSGENGLLESEPPRGGNTASPMVSPALTFMPSTKIAQSTMRLIRFIRMILEKVLRQEKREISARRRY